MKAMLLESMVDLSTGREPLKPADIPVPAPGRGEVLLKVNACGVCHTELDEIEGRTRPAFLPIVPGHQAVGVVEQIAEGTIHLKPGDRAGAAWIASSCGVCQYCLTGHENLCPDFKATGRDVNGGYAEFMTVREDFAFRIPEALSDEEAAPLLCAGAIGYRALNLASIYDGQTLAFSGFGGSAHITMMMAMKKYPRSRFLVFARSGYEREFARELGAHWAGGHAETPPESADAVIDTTPVWEPVFHALRNLKPNGRLIINAIRKEDADRTVMARLSYADQLWMEKTVKSVANVTRRDVEEFLALAAEIHLKPERQVYPLEEANTALLELKARRIRGAKVLKIT
jgi:propanol-preferring alcohol dehydrogenase